MLFSFSLVAAVALAAPYDEGSVVTYRGTFQAVKESKPNADKSFELTLIVGATNDDQAKVYWLLSDSDSQPAAWDQRWGELMWSPGKKSIDGAMPGFLYEHASGKTQVNIAPPLPVFTGDLKAGSTWSEGKIQFEVEEGDAVEGRPTWNVTARTLVGRRRTMQIDREDQRIYSVRENVFVGQGEEHLLKYEFAKSTKLEADALQKTVSAIEGWNRLRTEWSGATEDRSPKSLSAARKLVAEKLPALKTASAGTPLSSLAEVVSRQLKAAGEQGAAVSALRTKMIGKPFPKFELQDVANKTWTNESLEGKVTVLQFWAYTEENLREPYGQVGYLDYLARRNEAVQVLGVATASENPDQNQGQRAQVRKFRDFMNVSYPILLNKGELLKSLGDPRKLGVELPLFVVVDAKGKIVEFKAGLYEVKRDEGLLELEGAVKKAAGK